MSKCLFRFALASAMALSLAACTSSGWGQRGSQQTGDTHTLTGGAEAAPTSEATPKPAGPTGSMGGTGGTSGAGAGMGTPPTEPTAPAEPAQPVQPTENMGSSSQRR